MLKHFSRTISRLGGFLARCFCSLSKYTSLAALVEVAPGRQRIKKLSMLSEFKWKVKHKCYELCCVCTSFWRRSGSEFPFCCWSRSVLDMFMVGEPETIFTFLIFHSKANCNCFMTFILRIRVIRVIILSIFILLDSILNFMEQGTLVHLTFGWKGCRSGSKKNYADPTASEFVSPTVVKNSDTAFTSAKT